MPSRAESGIGDKKTETQEFDTKEFLWVMRSGWLIGIDSGSGLCRGQRLGDFCLGSEGF
jgi:hypothetical protein